MATILEAKAVISAADVTGSTFERIAQKLRGLHLAAKTLAIGGSVAAISQKIDAAGKKAAVVGRTSTMAVALPALYAASRGYKVVLEFSKELNKAQALGELNDEQRKIVERDAMNLGRDTQFTARQSLEMIRTYIQAGRTFEQARGMAKPTLDFALFGDVDPKKAADVVTSIAAAFQVQMDSLEAAAKRTTHIGDVIAKSANISRASVDDMAQGFKYAAPFAHAYGLSIEQLGAAITVMNDKGIRGDEAGVALRALLARFGKPTLDARQALAEEGLSFEMFTKRGKEFNFDNLRSGLRQAGIGDISGLRAQLTGRLAGKSLASEPDAMNTIIRDTVISGLGINKVVDKRKVAKAVARYLASQTQAIDFDAFVKALSDKKFTPGQIARLVGEKPGGKLATLFQNFVEGYKKKLDILQREAPGSVERGSTLMQQGLYGSHKRFISASENFVLAVGDSGATDHVSSALNSAAEGLRNLAKTEPEMLKLVTAAGVAAVALNPVVWALGNVARAAAIIVKTLPAAPLVLAAKDVVQFDPNAAKDDPLLKRAEISKRNLWAEYFWPSQFTMAPAVLPRLTVDSVRGALEGSTIAPAVLPRLTIEDVRSALDGRPAKAELTGQAEIKSVVEVKASPELIATIQTTISNAIRNIAIGGAPPVGTAGPTGSAMPEVGAAP